MRQPQPVEGIPRRCSARRASRCKMASGGSPVAWSSSWIMSSDIEVQTSHKITKAVRVVGNERRRPQPSAPENPGSP